MLRGCALRYVSLAALLLALVCAAPAQAQRPGEKTPYSYNLYPTSPYGHLYLNRFFFDPNYYLYSDYEDMITQGDPEEEWYVDYFDYYDGPDWYRVYDDVYGEGAYGDRLPYYGYYSHPFLRSYGFHKDIYDGLPYYDYYDTDFEDLGLGDWSDNDDADYTDIGPWWGWWGFDFGDYPYGEPVIDEPASRAPPAAPWWWAIDEKLYDEDEVESHYDPYGYDLFGPTGVYDYDYDDVDENIDDIDD